MTVQSRSAGRSAVTPAPVDRGALEAALRPFGESRMLPREAYVGRAVFDWEMRHFFAGGWTCVGRSVCASPGDQEARGVGDAGVFLVRDAAGTLRAFANACRHRCHELMRAGERANHPIVLCPYHGWSYRLDGSLRKAPGFDGGASPHFEPGEHGLVELGCEEWHGWAFVDGSADAGPLADHLVGLEEIVAPYEPELLVEAASHRYEVAANWKIVVENYHECYHCPVIHPQLCAVSDPRAGVNHLHEGAGAWSGGSMELREGTETMSLDGRSGATLLPGLDAARRRVVEYLGIFPNLLVSLHPDYVMTHLLTPIAPDRTAIECAWWFGREDVRGGLDPGFAVEFWDVTNRQDWNACESVQRGLTSVHAVPGPLSPEEEAVHQFETMVARGYAGLPAVPGAM